MKHIMKLTLCMLLVIVLIGCINIPLGDGNKLKFSKDGVVLTDEAGDETNIALDKEAGQLSISGGKEGEEMDVSVGMNVQVPEDFPVDIPLTDDAMIIQALKMTDGEPSIAVTYFTNNEFDSIVALYDDFIDSEFTATEQLKEEENPYAGTEMGVYMVSGERDSGRLVVTILANQSTGDVPDKSDDYNATVTLIFVLHQK